MSTIKECRIFKIKEFKFTSKCELFSANTTYLNKTLIARYRYDICLANFVLVKVVFKSNNFPVRQINTCTDYQKEHYIGPHISDHNSKTMYTIYFMTILKLLISWLPIFS